MTPSSVAQDRRARVSEPPAEEPRSGGLARAGIAAGVLAGLAMLACASASAALAGSAPGRPLALTAATFGADAPGAASLAAAALLWLVVSVALALVFVGIVPGDLSVGGAAVAGIGYSFLAMAVITSAVLPALNPLMREGMPQHGGAWVLAYGVFGAVLGVGPALRRRFARPRRPT